MNSRECFLAACRCEPLRRPPVWFMRQAGRWLPEYRALKANHEFTEIVRTPELAVQVTLQPLRRFPFDAAILFSDILVVPEALGYPYQFMENGGGVRLKQHVRSAADVAALPSADVVPERLRYMADAMQAVRRELRDETALLGFAGSPWTLATYLAGDGGAAGAAVLLNLEREQPEVFRALLERLTDAVAACLRLQIESGADAVQIFDSWGALADNADGNADGDGGAAYERRSLAWIRRVIAKLSAKAPVIVFAKGVSRHAAAIAKAGATVFSADAECALPELRRMLGAGVALQGNLAPELLLPETPIADVKAATDGLLTAMRDVPGHILNLAHGVPPRASLENAAAIFEVLAATESTSNAE